MRRSYCLNVLCILAISITSALMSACGSGINTTQTNVLVSGTANPLVAQVFVASGCAGQSMVEFGPDISYGRSTSWYPVLGKYQRTRILVAGMRASTTYHLRSQTQCSENTETATSQDMTFTTGPLPSSPFPAMTVSRPNASSTSPESAGIELVNIVAPTQNKIQAFFIDRDANPIWYYDVGPDGNYPFTMKLLPSGNVILSISRPNDSILREVDLAGNTVREMEIGALQQKTQAAGYDFLPAYYHHDILPLDNGHLIVLTATTKAFTDLPGYPGTTQVLGDALIDLDPDWNPVWYWNVFDHPDAIDVNRHLNGLPDWTHSNAVVYSPSDGNLLLSIRHESWIIKIDYNNGTGLGKVLWRLGYEGDFELTQNSIPTIDPALWFSFQHFPSIISQSNGHTTLAIWDNGDNRVVNTSGAVCGPPPSAPCLSRATVFDVDDRSMVANLAWEFFPGLFSIWGGSINQLTNGNVEFDLNAPSTPTAFASEVQEVTQTSSPQLVWQLDIAGANAYRAYRVPSLYPGVTWQY